MIWLNAWPPACKPTLTWFMVVSPICLPFA
jgi:hypothetical protein